MVYILDVKNDQLVKAEIVVPEPNEIPLKKDSWNFNWRELSKENNSRTFILKTIGLNPTVEGALQLKTPEFRIGTPKLKSEEIGKYFLFPG